MSVDYRIGDVRALLAEMPAGSVDLICTSPPYLSLRSYLAPDDPMKALEIGSERTPAEYISTLLGLTAEFRRVLAPHGSLALELGDTFSGSGGAGGDYNANGLREGQPGGWRQANSRRDKQQTFTDRKLAGGMGWPLERSLAMVPELYRVALAYGIHPLTGEDSPAGRWRVRNVVVHGRPNPPVGALGDKYRPACSYWAVACVNRRWFDLDSVRHEGTEPGAVKKKSKNHSGANPSTGWVSDNTEIHQNPNGAPTLDWFEDECDQFERDLWTIPTFGYKGAHFATFSPQLVKRFLLSMCPARVCRECGKPSKRITGPATYRQARTGKTPAVLDFHEGTRVAEGVDGGDTRGHGDSSVVRDAPTLGWTDCEHNAYRAGIVLDPFGGSGTTGMVAAGNGRDAILLDLDERNLTLARERIARAAAIWANPPAAPDEPKQGAWEL